MLTEDQIRNLLLRAGDSVDVDPTAPPVEALPSRPWARIAVVAVAATVAATTGFGLWLGGNDGAGEDPTETTILGGVPEGTVPSVFAHTRESASQLLLGMGLQVEFREEISCDPAGRPIGTEPATGTPVEPGDTVTVLLAHQAANTDCAYYHDEEWAFVDFATGRGPAPAFADEVRLFVDGELVTTMPGDIAAEGIWPRPSALTELETAAGQVMRMGDDYRTPTMEVREGTPPDEYCVVPRPALLGAREASTLTIDIPVDGQFHCPARVSIYRTNGQIDAVVTWTEHGFAEAPEAPSMPDTVGMTVGKARDTLTAAGYTVRVEELETCDPREGIVVEQAPGQTPAFDQDIDPDADYRGVVVTLVVEVPHTTRNCTGLRQAAESLTEFAAAGSVPPLAESVELYVGYRYEKTLSRADASDPAAWTVCAPETGISCPVSITDLLRNAGSELRIRDDMPNFNCLVDLGGLPARLSPEDWIVIHPTSGVTCHGAWAVQLWVDEEGQIRAANVMLTSM